MRKSKFAIACLYASLGILLINILAIVTKFGKGLLDVTKIILILFRPTMILSIIIIIFSIVSLIRVLISKKKLIGLAKSIIALILSLVVFIASFILGVFASAVDSTNEALGEIVYEDEYEDEQDKTVYTIPEFVKKDFDVVAVASYKAPNHPKRYVAGFIDKTGVFVIEPKFEEVKDFYEGLAPAKIDDKWGYIDKTGNFVIVPKFDEADIFSSGIAAVKVDDMWGYIDKSGSYIIEPSLEKAVRFSEGLAPMVSQDNGKIGFIDSRGKFVIEPRFDGSNNFSEGYAFVVADIENDVFGIVDKLGNFTVISDIDLGFEYNLSEGLLRASSKGESGGWGFIDVTGEFVIEPIYSTSDYFSEGLAAVSNGGFKTGFIDNKGIMVIEPNFYFCKPFSEGLSAVKTELELSSLYGYIDKNGEFVIEPKFDSAKSFSEGLALVYENDEGYGFIDKSGKYVIEPINIFAEYGRFHKIDRVYNINKADTEERKID